MVVLVVQSLTCIVYFPVQPAAIKFRCVALDSFSYFHHSRFQDYFLHFLLDERDFYYFLLSSVSKPSFTYATMGLLSVLLEHASAILGISSDNGGVYLA